VVQVSSYIVRVFASLVNKTKKEISETNDYSTCLKDGTCVLKR
jgi:hypothetical protein